MSELIKSNNISTAWIEGMRYLQEQEGETANLLVAISTPAFECKAVTSALDSFLMRDPKGLSIEKTASTIFPSEFYLPHILGARAQEHLYTSHAKVRRLEERFSKKGSYFDRMVRWQGTTGLVNQLERKIEQYKKQVGLNRGAANFFEIALSDPEDEYAAIDTAEGEAIRIYDPAKDRSVQSFPCLSHLSITLSKRRLHMTAEYRNQYFIKKAYGNYLGLLRLLYFLAQEIGVETGELLCVATHADAEIGDSRWSSKTDIKRLLSECEELLQQTPKTPIVLSRIPAPSWSSKKQINNGKIAIHELVTDG